MQTYHEIHFINFIDEILALQFGMVGLGKNCKARHLMYIILKLGFCEIQLKNTILNEQKDLILNNIKELIDNLLNLLKEKEKQKYKDILYSMLDYDISIQDIAKMKLEKYLK